MIKCILFDMDGVLINSEPLHFEVWKQVFAERGILIDYDHYKGCIGSTASYLFDLIREGYGYDFHGDTAISARFRELKGEIIKQRGIPEIEGVRDAIPQLRKLGYRLAVASSSPQDYIEFSMDALGIAQHFELLFSAERVANPKPAPDVFLAAASRLGVEPSECLVVEDSRNGSLAAKAAGMKCLGFLNPDSGSQDLSAADEIFYPFGDLIRAAGLNQIPFL